jgi:hypothetical protein
MPNEPEAGPSDRDLILATLEAICALARRITGERLVVNVGVPGDGGMRMYSSPASTSWISEDGSKPEPQSAPSR